MTEIISNVHLTILAFAIIMLLLALFSIAETSLLSVNRYKVYHAARSGSMSAKLISKLIDKPDSLLSVLLMGNGFLNNLAATMVTLITVKYFSPDLLYLNIALLTFISLVGLEIAPKTMAAEFPDRLAPFSAFFCIVILKLFYPLVWLISISAKMLLYPFRLFYDSSKQNKDLLNREEIKSLISMPGSIVAKNHQEMLNAILDLELMRVEEVMIPRQNIVAIDRENDWDSILEKIKNSSHSTIPIYKGDFSQVLGAVNARHLLDLSLTDHLTPEQFDKTIIPMEYSHEGTNLSQQLSAFKKNKQNISLVLDEHGSTLGMITLDAVLEEIIGSFSDSRLLGFGKKLIEESPGVYQVHGSISLRILNQILPIKLTAKSAKTFNGYLLEQFKDFPNVGTVLTLKNYSIKIMKTDDTMVVWTKLISRKEQTIGKE